MTHLLHVDSSASRDSHSRKLGRYLVDGWVRRDPSTRLSYRDLDADPLEFVSDSWVTAAFSPPEQRDDSALSRSELLIAELESADVLVLGAPMYNLGIPASLKAWVDQVVRVGRTFGYDGPAPVGLLSGKRAIVLATSGGDAHAYAAAGMDFRTPYLQTILAFIGIVDVDVVTLVGTASGAPDLATAELEIDSLLDVAVTPALVPSQG